MTELRDEFVHPTVESSSVVFDGAVWDVVEESFVLPGTDIRLRRDLVAHPGAVGIAAVDDEGRILLIRQYRHPLRVFDWEVPAGLLDQPGENPAQAAARELAEEADLAATQWHVLADMMNSPGGSAEVLRVFLARGLSRLPVQARHDEESLIELRWVDLDEALTAVLSGAITNATTCLAILHCANHAATGFTHVRPVDTPWAAHAHLVTERESGSTGSDH